MHATAFALLPLAAFLVGPAFDAVAPASMPSDLLLSVLPTVLPPAALVVVAVVSYRRTGSASRALRITSLLDEPRTAGQLRVRALDPELVWLAHEHEPWQPGTV